MKIKNPAFIKIVKDNDYLPTKEVNSILRRSQQSAYEVLLYMISEGILKPEDAGILWADTIGASYVNLKQTLFTPEVVSRLPKKFALENSILLIYKMGEKATAAMANPDNLKTIKEAERLAEMPISPVFSFEADVKDAVEIQYYSLGEVEEIAQKLDISKLETQTGEISKAELDRIAGDDSIVELVRAILILSLKEKASDIHIEPLDRFLRIRYRIDGRLIEKLKLDSEIVRPFVSRLKILANMDIAEHRRPLDGRISLELAGRSVDFRVSTTPSIYGEKVVLRSLGEVEAMQVPDIEDLYFSKSIYQDIKKLIKSPNGVFFVTGPTGSGKTTTLFSALKYINNPEMNIMTVEDPIEFRLPGITQIQVNKAIGLDFSTVLRSSLRQDPDVILIGEIRDIETAKTATEAALTGHLVLSTLHTNDAIQAITRLTEIGVEPFIVGPSIIGVIAQRLVRKICDNCKESYSPPREALDEIFEWDGKTSMMFYRGKGCDACGGIGYKGRIAVHEMVIINAKLRDMISRNASNLELKEVARENGFQSMWYDGIKKVLRGITTINEVEKVTFPDE